jgi:hypothetical protein
LKPAAVAVDGTTAAHASAATNVKRRMRRQ